MFCKRALAASFGQVSLRKMEKICEKCLRRRRGGFGVSTDGNDSPHQPLTMSNAHIDQIWLNCWQKTAFYPTTEFNRRPMTKQKKCWYFGQILSATIVGQLLYPCVCVCVRVMVLVVTVLLR